MSDISYNLVLQDRDWVMEKIAKHFHKYTPNSKLSNSPDINADVNFYFNWHAMKSKTKFDVCYFTHIEDVNWWRSVSSACDIAISMGTKYSNDLPAEKTIIFYPPPFENFMPQRRIKVLISGRSYSSGRKNFESAKLLKEIPYIDLRFTEGKLSEIELKQAYVDTDYVLITSKIEAGPMCIVEAIAMNKPVIAPDVGWCWDYPVIKYRDELDLIEIFKNIHFPEDAWKTRVSRVINKINTAVQNNYNENINKESN